MSLANEQLLPGCLDVWIVRDRQITDEAVLRRYAAWISSEEVERMNRFVFARHRKQYLVTRALVRSTLSRYASGAEPADWRFSIDRWGKPSIAEPPLPLAFNLSHTEGLVALAITSGSDVGIDIEHHERPIDLGIADRFFSTSEAEHLFCLPAAQQRRRFFDLWTLKEAYIKACGKGLSIPLDSFAFSFHAAGRIDFTRDHHRTEDTQCWQFCQFELDGFTLALCSEALPAGGPPNLRVFEGVPAGWNRRLAIEIKRCSAAVATTS